MRLSKDVVGKDDTVNVRVNVTNTGEMNGDEVVKLYVKDSTANQPHAIKALKGFCRVLIDKGTTKTVELSLPMKSLENYSVKKNRLIVRPGKYEIQIGLSSRDIKLKKTFTVL